MNWSDFAIAALTGVLAILGVGVGARMSRNSEQKRQKIDLFMEAYAKFTTDVLACAEEATLERAKSLSVSVARIELLCSGKTREKADEIAMLAIKRPIDPETLSELMGEFLLLAKKEIE